MVVAAGMQGLATIGLVWVTTEYSGLVEEQAEASEKAAKATSDSADASEKGARAAFQSAEAMEENTRAQLLLSLSEIFWSREFGEACEDLGRFSERDGFVNLFARWRVGEDPTGEQLMPWSQEYGDLNAARRRVKGYYHTVYRLQRASHFSREEVRDLLTSAANTQLLLQGVELLETVVTEDYDPHEDGDLYEFYHELYDGELQRPVVEQE